MTKPFHLAWFNSFAPPAWASPFAGDAGNEWFTGEYHVDIIKQMERAGFDFIMFEDSTFVPETYGGSSEIALKYSQHAPKLDPMALLPILARETSHIGLVATASTSFYPPFILARLMATLDHLTKGRVGWNVVTSSEDIAAQNYGMDKLPDHDVRYEVAEEFVDVVKQLWDSWEPGAVVMDRETGRYADHTKVHPIHHRGKHFAVRGPLNMPPGPQGHPVLCQAGGSPAGRDFAAKNATAIIATNPVISKMKEYREDIRARAEKFGRDPDDIKVLFQVSPVVAETSEGAKKAHHQRFGALSHAQIEQTLAGISSTTEIDFSQFDLDAPFPQDLKTNGHQSILDDFMKRNKGKTLRESIEERSQFGPPIFGTPAECADRMEEIVEEVGGDGFLIMSPSTRRYIDEICSGLAPELQRRGLVRTSYPQPTFKQNLLGH
ncbi:NtaA/DmoA family FMN-dependent monooxygenase [Nocardioides bruguierae]|uniref:NtaA/DmoA family FMN-dependent monooxygenase n=1 Tax=Nocardioides bruguierae TaxID=2945102 RepID=A0A9X2D978_9ACTN|nr:NtaA/DmoA family FMN-dependent monooxygenase [Nocardioides bruguierae]MCM0621137.1 NtaA/DmoA family FMN-dependent monooxygenase [Nocardioides bruguierae]